MRIKQLRRPRLSFFVVFCAVSHPAVSAQDTTARTPQIRAIRIDGIIRIDGHLDEAGWRQTATTSSLTQREPNEGASVSEKTEIHVGFDDRQLYVGIRCWDSDASLIVANEMRRDANLLDNDCVELLVDSYHDHRLAFFFATNPLGAQRDGIIMANMGDEEQNWDWNGVWENACSVDSAGWSAEIAIPFQTLRFNPDDVGVWGINFCRIIPRKREEAFWSPILRDYGLGGKYRVSAFGHLLGLEGIRQPGQFEFKPFVLGGLQTNPEEGLTNALKTSLGLDVKIHVTPNITADVTVNTDFAQVEADQEKANLTRFELFFPEKRDFFLEGASVFRFGERSLFPLMPSSVLFFSRRIGLSDDNTLIPLLGGVKVTGKAGGVNLGFLNMTADRAAYVNDSDEQISVPRTNYGVLRIRQDIMESSSIGVIALNKQSFDDGAFNRNFGIDANFYLTPNTQIGGFIAKSYSPGVHGDNLMVYGDVSYNDDLWSFFVSQNTVQDDFAPDMGFFTRTGVRKTEVSFGIAPRPRLLNIRQLFLFTDFFYIANQQGEVEARYSYSGIYSQFGDGSYWLGMASMNLERLTDVFEIRDGVNIQRGTYRFANVFTEYESDKSQWLAVKLTGNIGRFYDGSIFGYGCGLNLKAGARLTWNLDYQRNDVDVTAGSFVDNILGARIVYTFTPRLFAKAFIQWNSDTEEILANVLVNFIHTAGSDLFVVYNEELSTHLGRLASRNRTMLVKFTYLLGL